MREFTGGIHDKRFLSLQKKLIWDLDRAEFRNIDLVLYMRIGGWSHTGGTYSNAMIEVRALCREMFGYEIPEKIGSVHLRDYRYRVGKGLAAVGPVINRYHEDKLNKAG